MTLTRYYLCREAPPLCMAMSTESDLGMKILTKMASISTSVKYLEEGFEKRAGASQKSMNMA